MESLANVLFERVLCTIFSKEAMPSPLLARGGLHTLAQHLMAQLLSLQKPYAVKVAFEEGYQYDFD